MVNILALNMNKIQVFPDHLGISYFADNIAGWSTHHVSENISYKEGIYIYIDAKIYFSRVSPL